MNGTRSFKQKLSHVFRLWNEEDYDTALGEVESLLKVWPGNSQLHVLWASLVQLQEKPEHGLEEAKQALHQALDLDKSSPAAAIELGHFLDGVEDDPQAAAKVYSEAVAQARHLLIEGLIGQAKAFRQLDKREEVMKCLMELLYLTKAVSGPKRPERNGPYTAQIEELVNDVLVNRSA
jgi:tetratricopeptide (TPR) repeat protein